MDPFQWFQCLLLTDMKMFVTFSQPVSLPWWQISPERRRRRVVYLEATGVGHPVLRLWASETPMLAIWMDPHPWVSFFCAKFPDCVENVLRTPKGSSHRKYTGPGPRHMAHFFFCTRTVHFMWGFLRSWGSSLLLQFKQSFPWLERRGLSLSCPIAFEFHRPLLVYL